MLVRVILIKVILPCPSMCEGSGGVRVWGEGQRERENIKQSPCPAPDSGA